MTLDDVSEVEALSAETMSHGLTGIGSIFLRTRAEQDEQRVVGVTARSGEGMLLGYALALPLYDSMVAEDKHVSSTIANVDEVAVLASERRLGTGSALIGALARLATKNGYRELHASFEPPTGSMLRRAGWEVLDDGFGWTWMEDADGIYDGPFVFTHQAEGGAFSRFGRLALVPETLPGAPYAASVDREANRAAAATALAAYVDEDPGARLLVDPAIPTYLEHHRTPRGSQPQ